MTTACGAIAVMRTSRERKAIWGQSAQDIGLRDNVSLIHVNL